MVHIEVIRKPVIYFIPDYKLKAVMYKIESLDDVEELQQILSNFEVVRTKFDSINITSPSKMLKVVKVGEYIHYYKVLDLELVDIHEEETVLEFYNVQ